MNNILNEDQIPDYFAAQFPGGGQRGAFTVHLLEWFEQTTDLPTHQLLPYVTSGSVGILIASALYLPHPDHPKAARMSARQLAEIFPKIASRIPQPARFRNTNSREPFAEVIKPFIGHGKLKDFLGTVYFSSHQIGGLSNSYVLHGKRICPTTGEATYVGNPDSLIMDIAFAGTSLPSLFQAHQNRIDLAFAEAHATPLHEINLLFPQGTKGAFVRVGNFRGKKEASRKHLENSGYVAQAASFAITDAISDHTYSQTMGFANSLYQGNIFNLEYEIEANYKNPPAIRADIVTEEQFRKIRKMSDQYIADNIGMLTSLAEALKISALRRMANHPETTFGIPPIIQEFPLYQIPEIPKRYERTSRAFGLVAGKLTQAATSIATYSLRTSFEIANSELVQSVLTEIKTAASKEFNRFLDESLLPRPSKPKAYTTTEETQSAIPPSLKDRKIS